MWKRFKAKLAKMRMDWWLVQIDSGLIRPTELFPFTVDHGYIQGIGELTPGDAVLLPMKSGRLGVYRVKDSKGYEDFGSWCYSAHVEFAGVYYDRKEVGNGSIA